MHTSTQHCITIKGTKMYVYILKNGRNRDVTMRSCVGVCVQVLTLTEQNPVCCILWWNAPLLAILLNTFSCYSQKKGFQRRSWYSKKKKKNSFDRYRNQWQWAFCAYTSEIMMVSVLSLRFAVASWWSPTPGRATRGNTSALERTWWGRGRARSLNSPCSVKHFFAALWLHFYNFAALHLV